MISLLPPFALISTGGAQETPPPEHILHSSVSLVGHSGSKSLSFKTQPLGGLEKIVFSVKTSPKKEQYNSESP